MLVRAGSTDWDQAGRLQGHADLPLSDTGRQDVAEVTSHLNGAKVSTVLAAPDEASIETAQRLAQHTGARVRKLADLAETDLGLWEGLREKELIDRYPKAFRQWRDDPTSVTAPDGDSVDASGERILLALARAMDRVGRGGLAVVVRPIAFGVIRCWLEDRSRRDALRAASEGPSWEWASVPRDRVRSLLRPRRARVGSAE